MASKTLTKEPLFVPGQGNSEVIRNAFRIVRGPDIASAVGGATGTSTTVALFDVPANTFVHEIILDIVSKFASDSRAVLKVGDTSDNDGFLTASGVTVTTAGTRSSLRSVTQAAYGGGKFYTSGQTINAIRTCGTKASATGLVRTYIVYAPNIDFVNVAS